MYRQGDILLVPVTSIPNGATQVHRTGRLVIAEGEGSGHAHAMDEEEVGEWLLGPDRFIGVPEIGALLTHEEHGPIDLPGGAYRVVQQREYVPKARPVPAVD